MESIPGNVGRDRLWNVISYWHGWLPKKTSLCSTAVKPSKWEYLIYIMQELFYFHPS